MKCVQIQHLGFNFRSRSTHDWRFRFLKVIKIFQIVPLFANILANVLGNSASSIPFLSLYLALSIGADIFTVHFHILPYFHKVLSRQRCPPPNYQNCTFVWMMCLPWPNLSKLPSPPHWDNPWPVATRILHVDTQELVINDQRCLTNKLLKYPGSKQHWSAIIFKWTL